MDNLLSELFLLVCTFSLISNFVSPQDVAALCKEQCGNATVLSFGTGDLVCDNLCKIQQCEYGCMHWDATVKVTCQKQCNLTVGFKQKRAYCVTGCSIAQDIYARKIAEELGNLSAPVLAPDSKTNTSVELHWDGLILDNVTYLLEWQYSFSPGTWHSCGTCHQKFNTSTVTVRKLHPYLTYKFLVVAIISQAGHALQSEESLPIQTIPYGAPTSSPKITSVSSPSPETIHIRWDTPCYSNGPITEYTLSLYNVNQSSTEEQTVSGNQRWLTVTYLKPETIYQVGLTAWNTYGKGPEDRRNVTTQKTASTDEQSIPYLILGADNLLLRQSLKNPNENPEPEDLYAGHNESILILGVGIHTKKNTVFFSDTTGAVHSMVMDDSKSPTVIYRSADHPSLLSIDWLNDQIYIVESTGKKITRCSIEGSFCNVILEGLDSEPEDIHVDPYNGYLFWSQFGATAGIYQLDLADISSPTPRNFSRLVIPMSMPGPFSVDHLHYRIYHPDESDNTMLSAKLEGTDVRNIRNNTVAPNFHMMKSMAYYNRLFYWTADSRVFSEAVKDGMYYHNEMLLFAEHFVGLTVFHPTAQPTPVPDSSPRDIQLVFTASSALISWQAPLPMEDKGKGIWQDWLYEIRITGAGAQERKISSIKGLSYRLRNVTASTRYSISVRAYSDGGTGPWAADFTSKSLNTDIEPHLVVAERGALVQVSLDGATRQVLSAQPQASAQITDIEPVDGQYICSLSNGKVYVMAEGLAPRQLPSLQEVAAMAYDWLGKKIYWSNLKQNLIFRSDIAGNKMESVYQSAAQDLAVDALNGFLYWTSSHSVEAARLNGDGHIEYQFWPYFSGQLASGLTLDAESKRLFWIIQGYEGGKLYTADMAGIGTEDVAMTTKMVASIGSMSRYPLLHYFSEHLLWLNDENKVVMTDMAGGNVAVLPLKVSSLSTFSLQHPSRHTFPEGLNSSSIIVIPPPLDPSSIRLEGTWSSFLITWKPTPVNHGQVTYELSLTYDGKQEVKTTKNHFYQIKHMQPYTSVKLALRAETPWGSTPVIRHRFRSPMSVPSQPRSPKLYISHYKHPLLEEPNIKADFRWVQPEHPNGIVTRYNVFYSLDGSDWGKVVVAPRKTFVELPSLRTKVTYTFKVQACTELGCGLETAPVSADTSTENPSPRLIVVKSRSIQMVSVDDGVSFNLTVTNNPLSTTFLAAEGTYYWLDAQNSIVRFDGRTENEILRVGEGSRCLTVDWVGRVLFWVQVHSSGRASIWKHELDRQESVLLPILSRNAQIHTLAIDPYKSKLYWTEGTTIDSVALMSGNVDGTAVHTIFNASTSGRDRRSADDCNCPNLAMGSVFAMDSTEPADPAIYVMDNGYDIWRVDTQACYCQLLVQRSSPVGALPPTSMAVDHVHLYWGRQGESNIHVVDKYTGQVLGTIPASEDAKSIVSYGPHLQPLPDVKCMRPFDYKSTPVLLSQHNVSIGLQVAPVVQLAECVGMTMPLVNYTVHYTLVDSPETTSRCNDGKTKCNTKATFKDQVDIKGLQPYSLYLFQVAVSNYYTYGYAPTFAPPAFFKTDQGVPSPVVNVTAQPEVLGEILVSWSPPSHPNGELKDIAYEVLWRTVESDGTQRTGRSRLEAGDQSNSSRKRLIIKDLDNDQTYWFQVLAYGAQHKYHSTSLEVSAKTYLIPGAIQLAHAALDSIEVTWKAPKDLSINHHGFHYAQVGKDDWNVITSMKITKPNTLYKCTATGLKPNTAYKFRLGVVPSSTEYYTWPSDERFSFKTAVGVPGKMNRPTVSSLGRGVYAVVWRKPRTGGIGTLNYTLEYKHAEAERNWTLAYNGTEVQWMFDVDTLTGYNGKLIVFHVAASNNQGMGEFSETSQELMLPLPTVQEEDDGLTVILVASLAGIVLLIVAVMVALMSVYKMRKEEKNIPPLEFVNSPDLELANLRDPPRFTVQSDNTLYNLNTIPTEEDVASLPHFRRDQLTLTHFLGSGAFGEVFEGIAKNILSSDSGDTKCAVKTLHKGATDTEKEEFLKEALLMSNFKHSHILRLLGVCLDNDPQFIILELMEGGDLLSYLRSSRPTSIGPSPLNLPDLVDICVDVANGCKYLEEMHFVHRDLAARNCLVSCYGEDRSVKIGDFGLARDIYKNDYYRKEGEGLLPVRWMSPESLIDGVFTTQSDIWAFGVLMWEVLTLGQQPYPARTNIEVLHFVRSGGRLDRPDNCPDDLYQLMLKCWSYTSDDRPSFNYTLRQLEEFKRRSADPESDFSGPLRLQEANNYGVDNLAFDSENSSNSKEALMGAEDPDEVSITRTPGQERRNNKASTRLTPSNSRNRLRHLLGVGSSDDEDDDEDEVFLDDKESESPRAPRKPSLSNRLRPAPRLDDQGYLQPQEAESKYLELVDDTIPLKDPASKPPLPSPNSRKKPRSTPKMGTRDTTPKKKTLNYVEVLGSSVTDLGADPESSGSAGKHPSMGSRSRSQSPRPKTKDGVTYAQLANVPPTARESLRGKKKGQDGVSPPLEETSSNVSDNGKIAKAKANQAKTPNGTGPTYDRPKRLQSVNKQQDPKRSNIMYSPLPQNNQDDDGKLEDKTRTESPLLNSSVKVPKKHSPQADVRSKITGDTDLSRTALQDWNCNVPKTHDLTPSGKKKDYINLHHEKEAQVVA